MLKRRLDGKMLGAIILMVASVCASAFAGLRAETWSVNPSDYRYDMSLYFSLASKDYENPDLYEIGAFVGEECRGLAEKLDLPDGDNCMYMRIRSNSSQGEDVTFMMRNKITGEKVSLRNKDSESFIFKADQMIGLPSEPYILSRYFEVTVEAREHGSVAFENGMYAEGTVLSLKAVPETGYHFENWSDGDKEAERELTVNGNIELAASFAVNVHSVTFKIDDQVVATIDVAFGSAIETPEAPAREGYTFSGWSDLPETMPDNDLEIIGNYTINTYNAVFKIGDQIIATLNLEYGARIVAPEVPATEGFTFLGWGEYPETMPAHDIEIIGSYAINTYKAVFKIGDKVITTIDVEFGASINAPEAPEKEGYTFSGWSEIPETMPAHDIEITGSYAVNTYKAVFKIGDEVISTIEVEFGAAITAPEALEKEGYTFAGWSEIPDTMPAHDIEITGSYTVNTYKVVFKIGDEVISTLDVEFDAAITAPEAPEKEGYTFAGWSEIPETMPAHDIEITGSYIVNTYKAVFKIGDEVISTIDVEFGAAINAPEAPEKEGYTFAGWSEIPDTMPAHDIEITGSYTVNTYKTVFKIGDEVISTFDVEFGAAINAPEAPEKEGFTFAGWAEIPETMPAHDIEIIGSYTVNTYKVVFKIGDEVISTLDVEFGAAITPPEAPEKEGYTFAGWAEIPETMPTHDIEITGSYTVNSYKATFKIGDEVISTFDVEFGAAITAPEAPEKEGYTFAGWAEIPETMPAHDIEITGSYTVNSYKATFKIGDEVISTLDVEFGAAISAPDAPEKEGYTFVGWAEIPETMPAHDIEISGEYTVNSYRLTVYINDDIYMEEDLDFGTEIIIPDPELPSTMQFEGWDEEIPATMPAHDVEIHGTATEKVSSALSVIFDNETLLSIYNMSGVILYKDVRPDEIKDHLATGLYIINGKKVLIK